MAPLDPCSPRRATKHALRIAAAALVVAAGSLPASAEDAPPVAPPMAPPVAPPAHEPAAAPAAVGVSWIEGWESGRAAAAKSGKVMFVYVHRTSPT